MSHAKAPEERSAGVRQWLDQHRALAGVIVAALLFVAAALAYWRGIRNPDEIGGTPQQFFTVDDGKSWYPDDATKVPPVEHEGKVAYRVKVFKCPDGKEFVGYLERYTPEAKKQMEANPATRMGTGSPDVNMLRDFEIKKPGDKQWMKWTPGNVEQFARMMRPTCADGSTAVQPVVPQ